MRDQTKKWSVKTTEFARNTFNPIRNILENIEMTPNPTKKMISLSIGDPTVFGNLTMHPRVTSAMEESLHSGKYNGYGPATGFVESRQAVADHISRTPGAEITAKDVILCSGCSCSLDLCITALAERGQNILVPRPGFPLYATLANGIGVSTKEYNLLADQDWNVDLEHMESLIDSNTAAIVVNNPSNPCGSVFPESHLREILAIAERHCIPIIADEIYEFFTFPDGPAYVPMASLTTTVPILSCGGLTKRYLVPGWRLGWITVHDRNGIFAEEVTAGLQRLSQRIIGANTIVQGALPAILKEVPESFFQETIGQIKRNADIAFKRLSAIPGVKPVKPSGAMYMMVGLDAAVFPDFENDLQIVEAMVKEQSVFPLPGKCFNIPDFFRIVLTVPEHLMIEACGRIEEFCLQHARLTERVVPSKQLKMQQSVDEESTSEISATSSEATSSDEFEETAEYSKPAAIKRAEFMRKISTPGRLA